MSDLQKKLDEALAKIHDLECEVAELEGSLENRHKEISALEAELEHVIDDGPSVAQVVEMPSLDRDRFLADLCRECSLLGIDWPASPKDETARLTKQKDYDHA